MNKVFVDPVVVSPRELTVNEMSEITGGVAPIAVVWVTSCGEMLAGGIVVTGVTVVDYIEG